MELTGLKSFKNAGGSVYSSIGSSDSSKTVGYKYINNLPKFAEGTPGTTDTSTSSDTGSSSSTGNTATPSVTNISSGPSLTGGFGSTTSSFGSSLGTIQNSLTSPNGSQLLDQNSFGGSNYRQPAFAPMINWSSGSQRAAAIGQVGALANSIGSGNPINLNKSNQILQNSTRPTSGGAKGVNWSGIGGVVTSGVQFAGDAINSFSVNETGEDLQNKYGTSQQNVAGVGYESQNMIDANKELDRVKKENTGNTLKTVGSGAALGAAAGSIIPGLGTAAGAVIGGAIGLFTGLFGGASRKRRYREMLAKQNAKINALQDSSRFSAQTKAIQQMNAREYGNSEAQYLYGAKNGKLPCFNNGVDTSFMIPNAYFYTKYAPQIKEYNSKNKPTYSSAGETNVEPNAKVSKGEIIVNAMLGQEYRIPGKKNNDDTEDAYLNPGDMVVPNKGGLSDYYANTGDYKGTKEMLKNRLETAKNGRLPKFKEGLVGNAITSGLGAIGGLSQWWQANNSSPRKTDVYKQNDYEGVSLDILSRLGISPFHTMQNLRNAEARANRAIDMSGGLTTGQRTLTRLAALNNTQRAVADALQNIQMQNNNYFADYAKTALAAGAANAQRAMQANMYDEEMYAKAHAARQQGMQMGMRNIIDQLNNFYANEFKRRQFNETMSLYKQDQKLRGNEIQAIINNMNKSRSTNDTYSTVRSNNPTYLGDYGLNKDWSIASNSRLKNRKLFWGKDYSLTAPILPTSYTTYKYINPYDIRIR